MSLVNNMLKDLEKRRQDKKPDGSEMLGGLQPPDDQPPTEPPKSSRWKFLLIILIIVLVILIVVIYQRKIKKTDEKAAATPVKVVKKAQVSKPKLTTKKPALNSAPVQAKAEAKAAKTIALAKPVPPVKHEPVMSDVVYSEEGKTAELTLTFSQKVHYQVHTDLETNTFNVLFDEVSFTGALPELEKQDVVSKFAGKETKKGYLLMLSLAPSVALETVKQSSKTGKSYQLLFLFNKTQKKTAAKEITNDLVENGFVAKSKIRRTSIPLTRSQRISRQYQQALRYLNRNNPQAAVSTLEKLLDQYPNYMPARIALIKLLMREGEYSKAQAVLSVAISQSPSSFALAILRARIYFTQKRYKKALDVLQAMPAPPLKSHTEYYALIAALQQHVGHYLMAAELYKQLLVIQPNNSLWWMGMGIALEADDKVNQAVTAYKRALETGELNPNLHAFVGTRLQEMSG